MEQKSFIGSGSISNVGSIFAESGCQRVLLVTGKSSFYDSGVAGELMPFLEEKIVARFDDFSQNPKYEEAIDGVALFNELRPEIVIAAGGGSAIDMAKLIVVLGGQGSSDYKSIIYDSSLIEARDVPLVAIPTTAGTGSESTHFAVVYIDDKKYSVAHECVLPDYAIIDPRFCYGLPSSVMAATGLDALSQAVESYWAVNSTQESKVYAKKAIKLLLGSIEEAVCNSNKLAIGRMAEGANLSGKAINISKTTAPHAISYPITTYYGVPHGHAVALLLGKFFIINSQSTVEDGIQDERGLSYLTGVMNELFSLFGCDNGRDCCEEWYVLVSRLGMEVRLSEIGVRSDSDRQAIAENVNVERLDNNPVKLSQSQLLTCLSN